MLVIEVCYALLNDVSESPQNYSPVTVFITSVANTGDISRVETASSSYRLYPCTGIELMYVLFACR